MLVVLVDLFVKVVAGRGGVGDGVGGPLIAPPPPLTS